MKILFITESLSFQGGGERVLNTIAKYLISNNNEIRFLTHLVNKSGELATDKQEWVEPFRSNKEKVFLFGPKRVKRYQMLRIFAKKFFKIPSLMDNKIIKKQLSDFRPDVVIAIGYLRYESIKKSIEELGINSKLFGYRHNSFFYKSTKFRDLLRQRLLKTVLISQMKYPDAHLAISTGIRDQILKLNPKAKVYTVFNPLDPYDGALVPRSKKPIFLWVGRVDENQKNISFMLRGLSEVKRDWKLIIVGTGSDENMLKNLASSLGISRKIEWMGFKENPYEDLDEGVTALLLTSRFEGFPMVLAEANQRGIPVLSSDCPTGSADIVISGVNGYLYPEGDMKAFVDAINDVIDGRITFQGPDEIARTSERFSEEKVCKDILEALQETIGN